MRLQAGETTYSSLGEESKYQQSRLGIGDAKCGVTFEWHVYVGSKHRHRHRHKHSRRDGCSRVEVEAVGGLPLAGPTGETNRARAMLLVLVGVV